MTSSEYGAAGLVGILPPQANTTVEAELGVLLGPGVATIVSRLVCHAADPRARLLGYFRNVEQSLHAFDTARPDVTLFACTGSSYLVGREEDALFPKLRVVSAAQAVLAAFDALEARRIALVSPYPPWLTEACVGFWRGRGLEIVATQILQGDRSDMRAIYRLRSTDAARGLERLQATAAEAVLITGTGMPSLGAITRVHGGRPVLSSNLCLAWHATQALHREPLDRASLLAWLAPDAAWRARLAAKFPGELVQAK